MSDLFTRMFDSPDLLFVLAIAAVVFFGGLALLRARSQRTRHVGRKRDGGPPNLRFACAACAGKFTHSRQTAVEWSNGSRQFLCKACHTRLRGEKPLTRR